MLHMNIADTYLGVRIQLMLEQLRNTKIWPVVQQSPRPSKVKDSNPAAAETKNVNGKK
jgi:hypothetical protein